MTNQETTGSAVDDVEARLREETERTIAAARAETDRKIAAVREVQAAYHAVVRAREEFLPADTQRRKELQHALTAARRCGVSDGDLKGWATGPLAVKKAGASTSGAAGGAASRSRKDRATTPAETPDTAGSTDTSTADGSSPATEAPAWAASA